MHESMSAFQNHVTYIFLYPTHILSISWDTFSRFHGTIAFFDVLSAKNAKYDGYASEKYGQGGALGLSTYARIGSNCEIW